MAIWKEQTATKVESTPLTPTPTPTRQADPVSTYDAPRRATGAEVKESLIAAELTIEGKIEGSGHVQIVGAVPICTGMAQWSRERNVETRTAGVVTP